MRGARRGFRLDVGSRLSGIGGAMDLELEGKTALVTGASRGIGRAIAQALAKEGVRVALAARDKATLETAASEVRGSGGADPLAVPAHLRRLQEVNPPG